MKMTAESLLGFMEELIDIAPAAMRTNRPSSDGNGTSKRVFGERVLNRNKNRQSNAEARQ